MFQYCENQVRYWQNIVPRAVGFVNFVAKWELALDVDEEITRSSANGTFSQHSGSYFPLSPIHQRVH
jgi:hypothetical protein